MNVLEMLPQSWQQVEVGDIADIIVPTRDKPKRFCGDIPWVTLPDINDFFISTAKNLLTHEDAAEVSNRLMPPSTVLLSCAGSLGKIAITTKSVYANQQFYGLVAKPSLIEPYFLALNLKKLGEKFFFQLAGVSTVGFFSKDKALGIKILLPPIAEQKRIAAIAQKCDRLRRTRRYTQQLSDTYLQTVFLQMFAETESRNWDLSNLEDLVKGGKNTIRTGPFGSQLLHEEFKLEGDVAVLGIDNVVQNSFAWDKKRFITSQKYQELKRYTVYPGDVLITIMGTCGRCVVAPQNIPLAINTKHLCRITLDQKRCLPTYLQHFFLRHPSALRQLGVSERGAVMPGLNMGLIKELVIPLPPLPLQEKFAQIVQRFERLRAQQREADRQAEHLFQTVLHRAFRGEL